MTTNHQYRQMAKLVAKKSIHRLFTPDSLSILPEINFGEDLRFLDVGCKKGRLLFKLASFLHNYEFHGLDINSDRIKNNDANNKFNNIKFHCAPAEDMPFSNEYFDIIVCTNALHHFPQRVRALDEMHRVIKAGGELYILEGVNGNEWKNRLDKILRQSKFILPDKKFLPKTALFRKSYFIHYARSSNKCNSYL